MFLLDATNTLTPSSPTIPTSLGVAVVTGYIMHLLKAWSKVPWMSFYTTKINVAVRVILAGVGTLGVSLKWAAVSGGGGTLAITFPTLAVAVAGLWHWVIQYFSQYLSENVYQLAAKQLEAGKPN